MKLSYFKRSKGTKSEIGKIRREGNIPAILYGVGQSTELIGVKGEEIQAMLRNMQQGLLSTTVFELNDGAKSHKAIIKDIQYHVTSYAVQHIDFILLSDKMPVTVNV